MITIERRKITGQRRYRQELLADSASKSPIIIRRRSRVNPIFVFSLFSAALLYDAISSPVARSIWDELSTYPTSFHLAVGITAASVLAFAAYFVTRILRWRSRRKSCGENQELSRLANLRLHGRKIP